MHKLLGTYYCDEILIALSTCWCRRFLAIYRVYKKRNLTFILYNSDKTSTPSFWINVSWSLVCFVRSLFYFRQMTTSAEQLYQKQSFWDASKFVLIIMLCRLKGVKNASESKQFACNFLHQIFSTKKDILEVYLENQSKNLKVFLNF